MINPIGQNVNFRGNVRIGINDNERACCAKSINALEKNTKNAQVSLFAIQGLKNFASELAFATEPDKNYAVGLYYSEGCSDCYPSSDGALYLDVYDVNEKNNRFINVRKDLGSQDSESEKPGVKGQQLIESVMDLFLQAKKETFEALKLDKAKIKENQRVNEIFDKLA